MLFITILRSRRLCKRFLLPDRRAGIWSESQHPSNPSDLHDTWTSTQSILPDVTLKTVLCIKKWVSIQIFFLFAKSTRASTQQEAAVLMEMGSFKEQNTGSIVSLFVRQRFQRLRLAAWVKMDENLISCSKAIIINKKTSWILSFSPFLPLGCVWWCTMMDAKEKTFENLIFRSSGGPQLQVTMPRVFCAYLVSHKLL